MAKKGHIEEQILRALRQAESGTRVADICREYGISEATYYIWKKKYSRLGYCRTNGICCRACPAVRLARFRYNTTPRGGVRTTQAQRPVRTTILMTKRRWSPFNNVNGGNSASYT